MSPDQRAAFDALIKELGKLGSWKVEDSFLVHRRIAVKVYLGYGRAGIDVHWGESIVFGKKPAFFGWIVPWRRRLYARAKRVHRILRRRQDRLQAISLFEALNDPTGKRSIRKVWG